MMINDFHTNQRIGTYCYFEERKRKRKAAYQSEFYFLFFEKKLVEFTLG
jgi:hypothetical protein